MSGPLSGIKVIDLTTVVMGPFATQFLGDMGADVVKVESPNGDGLRYSNPSRHEGMSNLFMNNNRNKRSLVLNLKDDAGKEALLKLAAKSDVFVSNVRPKAMARLGLAYEDICKVNDRIVYVSGFGFGQSGPYAERAAYDDLIQGMIGIPNLFERAYGDEPKFLPVNLCDRVTGLNMVNAVTAALFHRERTGQGQLVEVPMFETMVHFLMSDHLGGYTFEPPDDPAGYMRILNPNRRPYRTQDGYLALLVYNDKQWAQFFQLIDRPELVGQGIFADMGSRGQNIVEVYGFVQEAIRLRTTEAWLDAFRDTDIPHAPISTLEGLLDDEHLRAVDFFQEFEHPSEGSLRTIAIPSSWSESQPSIWRYAPNLGEHSQEVLQELGYGVEEIQALSDAGTTKLATGNLESSG